MNRQERRELEKNGVSKDTIEKLGIYTKPATIAEVIQLARASAEDVCGEMLEDYRKRSSGIIMAMTLQLELLKELVISKGMITEEEFEEKYLNAAKEFEDKQREFLKNSVENFENSPENVVKFGNMNVSNFEVSKD